MEKIRVLVADDHIMVRDGLAKLLDAEDAIECVAKAEDGEQAIKLAIELKPDVAIIDVAMPRVNGIEAAKQIKEACPSIAVLIVSAYKYSYYVLACMKAGVDGYLLKDSTPEELIKAIYMVKAGKTVFDIEVAHEIQKDLCNVRDSAGLSTIVLGAREMDVLKLAAKGMGNKEIGYTLDISTATVASHFGHIFSKLGVESRTEAILYALKQGWFGIDDICIRDRE